jgi:hypothetical protein
MVGGGYMEVNAHMVESTELPFTDRIGGVSPPVYYEKVGILGSGSKREMTHLGTVDRIGRLVRATNNEPQLGSSRNSLVDCRHASGSTIINRNEDSGLQVPVGRGYTAVCAALYGGRKISQETSSESTIMCKVILTPTAVLVVSGSSLIGYFIPVSTLFAVKRNGP